MPTIDEVKLSFSPESLKYLNVILSFIMFGVALKLRVIDFKRIIEQPKSAAVGIVSQFLLLPAFTYLLILFLKPEPSIALGMIIVSACPGGNMSNFFSQLAKGNAALSVSLTAVGTALAIFLMPLNFHLWSSLYAPAHDLLREVEVDAIDMLISIITIAGIPLALGMLLAHFKENLAEKLSKFFKPASVVVFLGFVVIALANNFDVFINYIDLVIFKIAIHNGMALMLGFYVAKLFRLNFQNQKTIAIETGIQNSGLGLIIIFSFFDGLGGMALVAAWYGIWHLVTGLTISTYWSRKSE